MTGSAPGSEHETQTAATRADCCDKCGTPKALWNVTPCVRSLTQSPRHSITRFHIPIPEEAESDG